MSFQQGLSGLNAASQGLDVTGNNIANASTVGFKGARAEFADVFASSLAGGGASAVGIGTQVSAIANQFTQGSISTTNNPLDLSVNGKGFFRMSDNGAISYSRNGQFQVDKSGYLVDSAARRLTGYTTDANGNIVPSSPVDMQLSTSDIGASKTSLSSAVLNLDSRETQPTTGVFNPNDATSFNCSTALTVYDTLGNPHVMSLFFVKTAVAGQWTTHATMDGTAEANVTGSPTTVNFNTSGVMTTAMPLNISANLNAVAAALGQTNSAASPLAYTLDFTGSTQYGASFGVTSLDQNGYTSGRLNGVAIGADGVIQGRYSNGQSRDLGQVVLANFNNSQGLKPLGGNQFSETPDSGTPLVGAPTTGSLGSLQSAAVEESNVDLTSELINLITYQRAYQANAQTIKTQDAVMQTLVNIR